MNSLRFIINLRDFINNLNLFCVINYYMRNVVENCRKVKEFLSHDVQDFRSNIKFVIKKQNKTDL